ncbi:MAG: RNA-binding protein [Calditrichaeota bacterium]|nr:MAG: RNA-binding protein [Calditrichota bacterium]
MNIYVGNLSFDVTRDHLREMFEAYGEVESADVIRDRYSGESRGFGFVQMPNQGEAESAISELNGKEYMGRNLKVSEARPRRDHSGSRRFGR